MRTERSAPVVTAEHVGDIYRSFADEVEAVEAEIESPIDELSAVGDALRKSAENIAAEHRTARTTAAINAYHRIVDRPIPEPIISSLTGLDVVINAADDVIDVRPLTDDRRFECCSNLLFGHVLLIDELGFSDELAGVLVEYYTALAQVPIVERRLQQRLERATERTTELALARRVYEYDSVDIEAFAKIPGIELELDPEHVADVVDDLRTFRARHLLFEDIRHVERTANHGDTNPAMYFLRTRSPDASAQCLRAVASSFTYADDAAEYVDRLRILERRPESLEDVIDRKRSKL